MAVVTGLAMKAQMGVTTFGIQLKPVIPFAFFDPLTTVGRPDLTGYVELNGGFAFGMSIRVGITNTISVETGLGQITRNYTFGIANDTSGYAESGSVQYVGYELPISGLVFIRLGERTWMNTSLGVSLDMYPSDVQKDIGSGRIYMFRNNWIQAGFIGNLGVEYRTPKSGTFYLGATFHRPFNDMATADLTYYDIPAGFFPYTMRTTLDGSYLTVDVRYYFHEDPDRMRVRRNRAKNP